MQHQSKLNALLSVLLKHWGFNMARIRTIKPEFWRDESLASVSPEACLLAIGLLNHCDDEGYFNANPKLVESDIFPLRELKSKTTVLLQELCKIGYLVVFQGSDGKTYGSIKNFLKHQVINKKSPSKIKHLCELPHDYGSDTVGLPIGKERKGKEQSESYDSLFERFYESYPKKVGKPAALKSFQKCRPSETLLQTMLDALEYQKQSSQWQKDDGQYIPNPSTWLNQERWNDTIEESAPIHKNWI
jgi:hypothetical protein